MFHQANYAKSIDADIRSVEVENGSISSSIILIGEENTNRLIMFHQANYAKSIDADIRSVEVENGSIM